MSDVYYRVVGVFTNFIRPPYFVEPIFRRSNLHSWEEDRLFVANISESSVISKFIPLPAHLVSLVVKFTNYHRLSKKGDICPTIIMLDSQEIIADKSFFNACLRAVKVFDKRQNQKTNDFFYLSLSQTVNDTDLEQFFAERAFESIVYIRPNFARSWLTNRVLSAGIKEKIAQKFSRGPFLPSFNNENESGFTIVRIGVSEACNFTHQLPLMFIEESRYLVFEEVAVERIGNNQLTGLNYLITPPYNVNSLPTNLSGVFGYHWYNPSDYEKRSWTNLTGFTYGSIENVTEFCLSYLGTYPEQE